MVQGKVREITKGEEDDLLGKMEGTDRQRLHEDKQEPHINLEGQLAVEGEKHYTSWCTGITGPNGGRDYT